MVIFMQNKSRKPRTKREQNTGKSNNKKAIIISSAVILILAVVAIPMCSSVFSNKTASGMMLLNTSIGGLTKEEVEVKLDEEIAKSRVTKILIEEKEIDLDLNSAGFMIDKEKTLKEINKQDKKGFLDGIFSKNSAKPIKVELKSDKEQFDSVLDTLLKQEGLQSEAFSFVSEGSKAVVTINKDIRVVDKEQLFNDILNNYNTLATEYKASLTIAGTPTAKEISNAINILAEDARIENADGKTKVIPHVVGVLSDEAVISESLAGGKTEFSVPLKLVNPKVYTDDLGDDTFPTLLYKATTTYSEGDASRSTNVRLAASKINGQILNTGDVFSFNKVVGQRSYENGFKDANVFLADQVVKDVGGGICQVSSTLYAAVLNADLKIVERRNHNFVVGYAKPGIDATVSYGSIDFKFQNNKENPIKIKASASGGQMTVSIFGTKTDNNTVELTSSGLGSTPRGTKYIYNAGLSAGQERVTQSGSDGLRVQNYRTVKDANGKVIRTDNLGVSNYVPLVKIVETGDASKVAGAEAPAESPLPTGEGGENPEVTANPSESPNLDASAVPTTSPNPSSSPIPSASPTSVPTATSTPMPTAEPVKPTEN